MADTFEDLGIRSELVQAMEAAGYAAPTELQRAAVPVLRRGGNAVLHASAGAGVVAAYGLGVLDRVAEAVGAEEGEAGEEEAGPLRALVLVPDAEAATRTAESLARMGRGVGLGVAATNPGWASAPQAAAVVVTTPAVALEAMQASRLKLGGVRALVLDGVLAADGGREAVETVTASVPREAQRIVVAGTLDAAVADYVDRHVRRALHIPPTSAEEEGAAAAAERRPVGYLVAAEREKLDAVAALLAAREAGSAVVHCRTAARADAVAEALALRGLPAGREPGGEAPVVVTAAGGAAEGEAFALSYDVPFDAAALGARHAEGGVVVVEPRELPHLRRIAERARLAPRPEPTPLAPAARDRIDAFRTELRRALDEEDIAAQLLVLEPLFAEHSPAEVAAAASALLRRRAPAAPPAAEAPARTATRAPTPPQAPSYVRLFVGIGGREGIRPGDLVGAITGEAQIKGDQVGRIEIRDNFSIVEVASDVADRVIGALNGTTMKGRSLRVDYDRRGAAQRGPGPRGGGKGGGGERPRRRLAPREPRR